MVNFCLVMKKLVLSLIIVCSVCGLIALKKYKKTGLPLYQPTSWQDAVSHWNNPDPNYSVPIESGEVPIIFNFRPCPAGCRDEFDRPCKPCSCCCGICLVFKFDYQDPDYNNGEGRVLVKSLGGNSLQLTFTDRLNYNENMQSLIAGNVSLDQAQCAALGINANSITLNEGMYTVVPSEKSQYGKVIVNYSIN
ncbi:MAG: hypothetical protein JNL75_00170 [Chitinophagales bacterium]|nr:hypothetical protein [Chitinophagales bacterium]